MGERVLMINMEEFFDEEQQQQQQSLNL